METNANRPTRKEMELMKTDQLGKKWKILKTAQLGKKWKLMQTDNSV